MNKAIKGNKEEILFTKILNKKNKFWDSLNIDKKDTYAIHVVSKKFGIINQLKVSAKSDIFLAKGHINKNYLIEKDFYLSENDCVKFNLKPIQKSGISIKLANSRYTITKISPNTFFKYFGSNILAAGASIYSSKDFHKNESVLKGWSIKKVDFIKYFSKKLNVDTIILQDKETMSMIKTYSNNEIAKLILKDKKLSDLIFKGVGNFEEPFTAHWIVENNQIKPNYYIPFKISTGSGRSKGVFTIILKPR